MREVAEAVIEQVGPGTKDNKES
jgi:hypothetical protein